MYKYILILFLAFGFNIHYSYGQESIGKFISSTNEKLSYMGRIQQTDSCAIFSWTGTSVSINVKQTSTVKALLKEDKGNNYYYAIVDGDGEKAIKIKMEKDKQLYTIANNLSKGKHHIELFRIANTNGINTLFYGFSIDSNAVILKPNKLPKRKIEFFGNSITCGHGVDVPIDSSDSGAPEYFNNYKAYGAITARYFNAQYHCTAKSGIGIMISWFSEIMPEIFDKVTPSPSASKWDFSKYQPNIVVINLGQNDSWLVNNPSHPQFKARFGETKPTEEEIIQAYIRFIKSLRSVYPKANIICCLGNMDATREGSKWPGYINAAVDSLQDKKIVSHFFPYKKTKGHPKVAEQQAMATDLIEFIEKGNYWKN